LEFPNFFISSKYRDGGILSYNPTGLIYPKNLRLGLAAAFTGNTKRKKKIIRGNNIFFNKLLYIILLVDEVMTRGYIDF